MARSPRFFSDWHAAGTYQDRVARLRSGAGGYVQPQKIKLVHNQTVFDDTVVDTLWGGSDLDWFFFDMARDRASDKLLAERVR